MPIKHRHRCLQHTLAPDTSALVDGSSFDRVFVQWVSGTNDAVAVQVSFDGGATYPHTLFSSSTAGDSVAVAAARDMRVVVSGGVSAAVVVTEFDREIA